MDYNQLILMHFSILENILTKFFIFVVSEPTCLSVADNGDLELFDNESGPDLTLSPQTFTSTAEAFINDNSDSLGVPGDNDPGKIFLI